MHPHCLKLAIILIGIAILALCILLVPKFGNFAGKLYPDMSYMKYLFFIVMYGAAVPFYFALYQAFNPLRDIDVKTAFSELSINVFYLRLQYILLLIFARPGEHYSL